jgi:hypothetical protein
MTGSARRAKCRVCGLETGVSQLHPKFGKFRRGLCRQCKEDRYFEVIEYPSGRGKTPEQILNENNLAWRDEWIADTRGGMHGSFMHHLLELAWVADAQNLEKLMQVFPYEMGMVLWYRTGTNPQKLAEVKERVGG